MFFNNIKIKTKFVIAFSVIASFTILISAIAILLFGTVKSEIGVIVNSDFEGINRVLNISDSVQKINVTLEGLLSVKDAEENLFFIEELEKRWVLLIEKINDLKVVGVPFSSVLDNKVIAIQALVDQLPYLSNVSFELIEARSQSHSIHQEVLRQHNVLRAGLNPVIRREYTDFFSSEDTGVHQEGREVFDKLINYYDKSNKLSSLLLETFYQKDNVKLNAMGREALRLFRELSVDAATFPGDAGDFSVGWLADTEMLVVGERSIFNERRREKRLATILDALVSRHKELSFSLENQSATMVFSLRHKIENETLSLKRLLDDFTIILVATSIACFIIVTLIIWLYVGKRIIAPIVTIKKVMGRIAGGDINVEIPKSDNDEIGDMLNALSVLREYVVRVNVMARYDGLTGLQNRRQFDYVLKEELRRCKREGAVINLLFCDIDYFKNYNDSYGHVAGDECLKTCAKTIMAHFNRVTDQCFRYGGEEFSVIMTGLDERAALNMAERLREKVESHKMSHEYSECAGVVTISVGLVSVEAKHLSFSETLLRIADIALYEAKNAGRNQVAHIVL